MDTQLHRKSQPYLLPSFSISAGGLQMSTREARFCFILSAFPPLFSRGGVPMNLYSSGQRGRFAPQRK
jgi:hypothetical protein